MKTLGDQAKAFRESRGWNTTDLAKAVGTSRQNIESLEEHGNRIPKYIGDLALAMGKSVDQLLVDARLAKPALLEVRKVAGAPWPFKLVERDRYEMLDDLEKGAVQAEMQRSIENLLAKHRTPVALKAEASDLGNAPTPEDVRRFSTAHTSANPAQRRRKA